MTAPAHLISESKPKRNMPPASHMKTHSTQISSSDNRKKEHEFSQPTQNVNGGLDYLEIEPNDTLHGYTVIKRGAVRINSLFDSSVRQLLLCGNEMLFLLKTPS